MNRMTVALSGLLVLAGPLAFAGDDGMDKLAEKAARETDAALAPQEAELDAHLRSFEERLKMSLQRSQAEFEKTPDYKEFKEKQDEELAAIASIYPPAGAPTKSAGRPLSLYETLNSLHSELCRDVSALSRRMGDETDIKKAEAIEKEAREVLHRVNLTQHFLFSMGAGDYSPAGDAKEYCRGAIETWRPETRTGELEPLSEAQLLERLGNVLTDSQVRYRQMPLAERIRMKPTLDSIASDYMTCQIEIMNESNGGSR